MKLQNNRCLFHTNEVFGLRADLDVDEWSCTCGISLSKLNEPEYA